MPDIWLGRFSRFVEKLFNAKGGPVLVDIAPSLQMVVSIDSGVENRYLQGWNIYHGSSGVAAVAAQFSRFLLRNPPGSNVLAVVEWINTNSNSIDMAVTTGQPNLANVQAAGTLLRRLDARSGFIDSTLVVSTDNSATQFPGTAAVIIKPNSGTGPYMPILSVNQEIPILPGDALWFASDVVNVPIQVNIRWRERALESSEFN